MSNKKGIIEDWIPLFVSLIVMVLVIVFFIAIKSGNDKEKMFLQGKNEVDAYQHLNNFLRLNSDLIILRADDVSYEIQLREKSREYFKQTYHNKWRLRINYFGEIGNYEPETIERLIHYNMIRTEIPYFEGEIEVIFNYD